MVIQDNSPLTNEGYLNIREYLNYCRQHWRWFAASVLVIGLLTTVILLTMPRQYERTTQIMIKDNDPSGNITAGLSALQSLGLGGGSSNVSNELAAMTTPSVMQEVVKRLKLDYNYSTWQFICKQPLYGSTLPINVTISGLTPDDKVELKVKLQKGNVTLSGFKKNKDKMSGEATGHVNKPIKTPIGNIVVSTTPAYSGQEDITIDVLRQMPYEQAARQRKQLLAGLDDELAQVISLTYRDESPERAIDILNTLIQVYNESWMRDKNDLNSATSRFIDGRLAVIEQELGSVERDITEYKSKNLIPDIQEVSKLYMAKSDKNSDLLVQLNSQMYMASYVRDYLKDNSNKNELLPANLIINDQNIEQQIVDYNKLQLDRNRMVLSSSEDNPLVKDMDKQLKSMRAAVIATIDNVVKQLRIQINDLYKSEQKNVGWIESSPEMAKHLLSAERQQKVQETLYIFLLQKREENVLSQAFTAYNTRILTPPTGAHQPVAPRRMLILAAALMFALLLPAVILFILMNFDTSVHSVKDFDGMTTPLLGCIDKKRNDTEQVVRNIGLMKAPTLLLTSIGHATGKTATAQLLAQALTGSGKHVALIDLDLRQATLSKLADSAFEGVADYLGELRNDWQQLMVRQNGVDLLPAGAIPPNPAQLLASERLQTLVSEMRRQYDYIIIDSTPVDKGDDATLAARTADLTVFTVRKGSTERSSLSQIEQFTNEQQLSTATLLVK